MADKGREGFPVSARRTEFRSDSFVEYVGEHRSEYQYRELGEVWEGNEALYLFVKPRKFLILQKKERSCFVCRVVWNSDFN